jgi:hypothetical protein
MTDDIERQRAFIYSQIGEEALHVLRESGLDVDSAVTRVLQEQKKKQEKMAFQTAFPTVADFMTSELVYRAASLDDVFGKEYARRMSAIGLAESQVKSIYHQEALILASSDLKGKREEMWAQRYFFMDGTKAEDMPKKEEFTLSELILITDDASSAYSRDHHWLSPETWQAVCMAAIQAYNFGGAKYALAFNDRTEALGWKKSQNGAFTRNESMLTERLKWGYTEEQAWTEKTADLAQYER